MLKQAVISECGSYRYTLDRGDPADGQFWGVVMVNPSTATATLDDPTIRKLLGFAERNGWAGFRVVNLFAYRATDVKELRNVADPVGPRNDTYIEQMLATCDNVLVAWGAISKLPPALQSRWGDVVDMIHAMKHQPHQIGTPVAGGHPRHPLMPSYDEPIWEWDDPRNKTL